jgi:hypothetical protein
VVDDFPKSGSKGGLIPLFFISNVFIIKQKIMAKYVLSEKQLEKLKNAYKPEEVTEGKDGNYMVKQQLFVIATLAKEMWDLLEENEELDDWMTTKIAQAEQSISSVVKAYMYDEYKEELNGMDTLSYNELVIGK